MAPRPTRWRESKGNHEWANQLLSSYTIPSKVCNQLTALFFLDSNPHREGASLLTASSGSQEWRLVGSFGCPNARFFPSLCMKNLDRQVLIDGRAFGSNLSKVAHAKNWWLFLKTLSLRWGISCCVVPLWLKNYLGKIIKQYFEWAAFLFIFNCCIGSTWVVEERAGLLDLELRHFSVLRTTLWLLLSVDFTCQTKNSFLGHLQ